MEQVRREEEIWTNSLYQVNVRILQDKPEEGMPPMAHLSVKRLDKLPIHDWRDLQRIKNELVGPSYVGVEVYPAEDELVDTSNQYHLGVPGQAVSVALRLSGSAGDWPERRCFNVSRQRPLRRKIV